MVESQPSKLLVAGSIPVSRSSLRSRMKRAASYGWQARFARTDVGGLCKGAARAADLSAVAASWRRERAAKADVAQLAERVLGKDEVSSSILLIGSNLRHQCERIWPASRS